MLRFVFTRVWSVLSAHAPWLVLIVAVLLRLPLLDGSFWLDEAAQALESSRPLSQQLNIAYDFQPPLLHLITHFALKISAAEWWLRTIGALIPGLVTIWGTYYLGTKLVNKSTGVLASLLLTTSSFHIFYSQELRPYSLPAMCAVLSWVCLVHALSPTPTKTKRQYPQLGWWLGFAISTALGLYASYLYPFLVIGQVAYVIWQKRALAVSFFAWLSLAALLFLPWTPSFLGQLQVGTQLRADLPGWDMVVSTPQIKALALVLGKFVFGVLDLEFSGLFIVGLGILTVLGGAIIFFIAQQKSFPTKLTQPLTLFLVWLIVSLLTSWLISFWVPVVQPKRVLMLLPAFYLVIATILARFPVPKLLKIALFVTVLAINLFSTVEYYRQSQYQREDWRSLHQEIVTKYPADRSIAVFVFPEAFAPWRWYDSGEYPTLTTGAIHLTETTDITTQLKPITEYDYVLTFDYLTDLTDPNQRLLQEITAFSYQEVAILERPNIGFVRVFARREQRLSSFTPQPND